MPRKVDHDERRQQVVEVVEDLVAETGVEGLTVRNVAQRAGCSTSIVSHYFASKLDLFLHTRRVVRGRAQARLLEEVEKGSDLLTALGTLLPKDAAGKRDWHTWLAFWGMAPVNPEVTEEHQSGAAEAREIFSTMMANARASGEITDTGTPEMDDIKIQIILNGIATLVLQEEDNWPAERQVDLLRDLLRGNFGYTG